MNRESYKPGAGRVLAGYLLGMALAILSPIVMLSEILSLMVVVMLPCVGLVALNRWAGKGPALFSGMLMLVIDSMYLGSSFMWLAFFLNLAPLAVILKFEKKPFFTQVKASIWAFGAGVILSVAFLYLNYGGNMIERMMLELPKAVRELPEESVAAVMGSYSAVTGSSMGAEEFFLVFDRMIETLIPVYQMNLPGLIFSGALVSALLCVGINGKMRAGRGIAEDGTYLPLREWHLPGSATGGLLLILAVSLAMKALDMPNGDTLLYTVYDIATAAFCIQALSSMARHLHASPVKGAGRIAIILLLGVLCLLGASLYAGIYGLASAVFGRKGALRERFENKRNDDNHSDGNE